MIDRDEVNKFINDNYERLLAQVIKRYRLDEDIAREVLHESLNKLIEHHVELEQEGLRGWLSRVIHTTYIDWLRRERRRQEREVPLEEVETELPTEEEGILDQIEVNSLVRSLLSLLSEEERKLLEARYIEGLGISQLSQRLGISEGTVKSRLGRAMNRLREILGVRR